MADDIGDDIGDYLAGEIHPEPEPESVEAELVDLDRWRTEVLRLAAPERRNAFEAIYWFLAATLIDFTARHRRRG